MGGFGYRFNFMSIASPSDACNTERARTALPVTGSSLGVGEVQRIEWVFYRPNGRIEAVFILGNREERLWGWLAQA